MVKASVKVTAIFVLSETLTSKNKILFDDNDSLCLQAFETWQGVTALFKNTRTLKFKSQPTFAFFDTVNHLNGPLSKQNFT